jgi:hypothetical protein
MHADTDVSSAVTARTLRSIRNPIGLSTLQSGEPSRGELSNTNMSLGPISSSPKPGDNQIRYSMYPLINRQPMRVTARQGGDVDPRPEKGNPGNFSK